MPLDAPQTFLRELDKKLWIAALKLHANLDAAACKYSVPWSSGLRTLSSSGRNMEIQRSLLPAIFTSGPNIIAAIPFLYAAGIYCIANEKHFEDFGFQRFLN